MRGNIDERGKKLFIGGLHLKTTEDSLKGFYSQWGEIVDVVVMRDPQTGKSRGFGFVTYSDALSVDDAQNNRPHEVDGIKVDSKRAMPKEDTSPEFHATVNRLFVGRLKRNVVADDLRQYFGEYGTIVDAVIINNSNGESRGFGFVTFEDTDSVDKIIVTRPHQLDGQSIEVKKALPRDDNKSNSKQSNSVGNKSTPKGGYNNNTGSNNRYSQDDFSSSYGNYPSANNSYNNRNYGTNYNQGYSQNYSSNKFSNNRLSEPFNNENNFSQPTYSNDASYSYGQYDTPNPPSSRYGYPPYGSGMGDYNQRQGGGPMRGAPRPSRGGAGGYGNYPY